MKKNKFKFLAILIVSVIFISCDKDDITVNSTASDTKLGILTFKTSDEFNETLLKVNSMSESERSKWESEKGFKSFGTVCDEFYKTIDTKSFKNIEEVNLFVSKYSDKIELYTSTDGESYCVTKDFNTAERYLINEKKACIIDNKVCVFSKSELLENQLLFMKKVISSVITEDEAYGNNTIGSDTYRIHTWIDTYLYTSQHRVAIKVKNFSRALGIWWLKDAWTKINFTFTTSDSQNHINSGSFTNNLYYDQYEWLAGYTSAIYDTTPFFTNYNCHTENKITKSNGQSCVCVADLILN